MKLFNKDMLSVGVYETRDQMGKAAAKDISDKIRILQAKKNEINMIFAAAPSQNEMLEYLCKEEGILWDKINAFHMDEYVGLDKTAPQGFGNFLKKAIFDKKPFKSVNYINPQNDADSECLRYAERIKAHPIDIVCLGIGENGHIAFNDPHVADFNDERIIKKVSLDEICRKQQVNDGCFSSLEKVPKYALTLTMPTLFRADYLFCTVPAKTKANAVKETVYGEISEKCPASIMRTHCNAKMYCDSDSGKYLL